MTAEQILKLVEAGYTKAEINAMTAPAETSEAPAEEVTPEAEADNQWAQIMTEVKALKEALQLKNLHTDEKAPEVKQSAEDILIQILKGKEN